MGATIRSPGQRAGAARLSIASHPSPSISGERGIVMKQIFCAVVIYLGLTGSAFAYVDPGILAVLYQIGYAVVLGIIATFFIRPWAWLKSLFSTKKSEKNPAEKRPEESDQSKSP